MRNGVDGERFSWGFLTGVLALVLWGMAGLGPAAHAKDQPLLAIELYDGPSGAAYVLVSNLLINDKAEMRACPDCSSKPIDKAVYSKLDKLVLGPGGVLQRDADGVLRYSLNNSKPVVVFPMNVKFGHNAAYTPSEMGNFAALKGSVSGTNAAAPPLNKGVALVFVSAPDTELSEYLLARRVNSIPGWQNYLSKYTASTHTAEAKSALSDLFVAAGNSDADAFEKTVAAESPAYDQLKAAKEQAGDARDLNPNSKALIRLDARIQTDVLAIVDRGNAELKAYQAALSAKTTGYSHLLSAKKYVEIAGDIDATTTAFQDFQSHVLSSSNAIASALRSADSAKTARQFDQALAFVQPYLAFAPELPQIVAIVDADYNYHLNNGRQAESAQDWKTSIEQYEKAIGAKDTAEARNALKNAQEQEVIVENKAAAAKALETSKEYENSKDIIRAYEVLDNLPVGQKQLVTDDMERLKPAYVQSISQMAKTLRQAHEPIRGLADEVGIENAYRYIEKAYDLSQNESFHDRMDLLGNELSGYLLDRAKYYLAKPAGSGTELGWMYLTEALSYRANNLDAVRDAMVAAAAAHAVRSKLSIRVQFRDQTSQRDSAGFTGQLESAITTGLEETGIPVKVVRAEETIPVEPDFQLAGDVLQHHLTTTSNIESVESKYLAGEREVPNDAWNAANRNYEKAGLELQTAQAALQGAEAKGNKSQVKSLQQQANNDQKKVEDTHAALDAIPKTVMTDIIRPYTYTKKTIDMSGIVQLQFRIGDSYSGQMANLVPITVEEQKESIVLENVKSEDTEGIKESGTVPDPSELLAKLETSALNSLIAEVRKRVNELPGKVYAQAKKLEDQEDIDSAGEAYLRFLTIARGEDPAEKQHATEFLDRQFNMHPGVKSSQ